MAAANPLRVISLGAGVQSTTMALMAAHGEIGPMPDYALFADTGNEPGAVYDHLRWLMSDNVLPFPVHITQRGNIKDDVLRIAGASKTKHMGPTGSRRANPPFFVDTDGGDYGMLHRTCTGHYKVEALDRFTLQTLGIGKGQRRPKTVTVEKWIGISLDEIFRAKPSPNNWAVHRFPLLEKRMHRHECLTWMERHGYPKPPKSACIMCPYRSDDGWRAMRENSPAEFKEACQIDEAVRDVWPSTTGNVFLHRSLVPLAEVDLSTAEDHGQLNLFNNECEGMCGV